YHPRARGPTLPVRRRRQAVRGAGPRFDTPQGSQRDGPSRLAARPPMDLAALPPGVRAPGQATPRRAERGRMSRLTFSAPHRPKCLRLLLCLPSLHPTQGGIASTNRNIVRALQGLKGEDLDLDVWVLAYHGDDPRPRPEYLEGKPLFRAEGCRSSRWRFV